MDREQFLNKLFGLYATTFSRGNASIWSEAYKQVLKENIDYDKLYEYMLANYAGASAPSPAFLLKNAVIKYTPDFNKSIEWENIEADINGMTYEFALDCPFGEARTNLEKRGFTNVRLKKPIVKAYV